MLFVYLFIFCNILKLSGWHLNLVYFLSAIISNSSVTNTAFYCGSLLILSKEKQ